MNIIESVIRRLPRRPSQEPFIQQELHSYWDDDADYGTAHQHQEMIKGAQEKGLRLWSFDELQGTELIEKLHTPEDPLMFTDRIGHWITSKGSGSFIVVESISEDSITGYIANVDEGEGEPYRSRTNQIVRITLPRDEPWFTGFCTNKQGFWVSSGGVVDAVRKRRIGMDPEEVVPYALQIEQRAV